MITRLTVLFSLLSAALLGQQAGTADALSSILTCAAFSNSSTTYECVSFPTFTPRDRDMILFNVDVQNSGPATLSVNGFIFSPIIKAVSTPLASADLKVGGWYIFIYDGLNWQAVGLNGSGGGGGGTVTVTGSPINGELTKFSGGTSITNANLTGDVTTTNTLATVVAAINGTTVQTNATVNQTLVTVAPGVSNWVTLLNCDASHALAFDTTTHSFFCQPLTSGGTVTSVTISGTANQITATGTCTNTAVITCTLSLPSALILPGTVNGLTITTTTGVLTIANAKTATINNSIVISGTDSTTMTFPTTSATIARTDAGQTFTGVNTFSSPPVMSGASISNTTVPTASLAVVQGNGAKVQLSTGTTTLNDCAKFDTNGNIIDAGSACSAASCGGSYAFTSQTTFTVTGATHGCGSLITWTVYDTTDGTVDKWILPNTFTINKSTFDVIITFSQTQTGRIVIQ